MLDIILQRDVGRTVLITASPFSVLLPLSARDFQEGAPVGTNYRSKVALYFLCLLKYLQGRSYLIVFIWHFSWRDQQEFMADHGDHSSSGEV